jgi:2-methylcitrate dehydratase PrpD
MAACVLGLAPTLVSMWPLCRATAGSAATEASTAAAHASRRGVGAVSSALSGLRGRYRTYEVLYYFLTLSPSSNNANFVFSTFRFELQ